MEAIGKLLDHLGYATPLLYAAAAYGLFYWLDENTSEEAKATVTSMMESRALEADRIVSALQEIFDRIYTHPLWSKRAFRRSTILTISASVVTFPMILPSLNEPPSGPGAAPTLSTFESFVLTAAFLVLSLSVNILTDYVSLFYIRRCLTAGAKRPVLALMLGASAAILIVTIGNLLRNVVDVAFIISIFVAKAYPFSLPLNALARFFFFTFIFSIPALIVFVWLPLFAIGILVARVSAPLFWAVGKTQWFLKDGKNHPLKAVGFVAAIVVVVPGVVLHYLF